ncbi:ankyrin repeat domain-containing protein [Hymenobacter lucidus]|uniref:Ankyrin repeat domain-containing protein n=1 Tax=Hymenobacter lucidus TaxID=2880930 RepID=A0ABS8ALN5_9BACT|nr:ankyrin repeat domain-containing protein [Hymenobacter lucidus]MCB2406654.1 ankyrin repeat domain-containing protein [Hymenobacter lucidus]
MKYPLHEQVIQSDLDGVMKFIAQRAPLDELDELGHSPLHWAVFGGYTDIVRALLQAGACPNVISTDGVTPKWHAEDFGLEDIIELLTVYGGKVQTDSNFNRAAFSVFLGAIGKNLPEEEV